MKGVARAAVMTAPRKDLKFREYPIPAIEPGCILVRITCCTICGSDIHSWLGHRVSPVPIILGHEIVGTIEALGEGVTHDSDDAALKIGDRITWTIMDNCGKCYYCRTGSASRISGKFTKIWIHCWPPRQLPTSTVKSPPKFLPQ